MNKDPQKINLSLVSHTNVGKTTLARTLLGRDIGEVGDRSHVTTEPEDYVLLRAPDDSELILWDTPGFGDSVRLAERLKARSNPIGWFTSEIWDRLTDKSLWLNQQAIKHVRDKSLVILYLVNASESPEAVPYVKAEMDILTWVNKPVIVLLNQMGEARPPEQEKAEVELWRDYLKPYSFVKAVLPMDAFARCWVQEYELWKEIESCLTDADKPTFASLHATWIRQKQALYSSSLEAMAAYMVKVANDKEVLASQSLIDRLRSIGRSLGFIKKDLHGAMEDAQVALSTRAADWLCTLTQRLININGLEGSGTKAEILRRMRSDWETQGTIDPKAASLLGAVAGGAVSGIAADIATGGATLGLGALGGAIVGALGGAGAAAAYNVQKGNKENIITWSAASMDGFLLDTVLLYLAVAHFGRGRGQWEDSESPAFWKTLAEETIKSQNIDFKSLKEKAADADQLRGEYTKIIDKTLREIFKSLYGVTI